MQNATAGAVAAMVVATAADAMLKAAGSSPFKMNFTRSPFKMGNDAHIVNVGKRAYAIHPHNPEWGGTVPGEKLSKPTEFHVSVHSPRGRGVSSKRLGTHPTLGAAKNAVAQHVAESL